MPKEKYIVGLTGGIGSGKSTVAEIMESYGFLVVDADVIAREVVKPGCLALKRIVDCFGQSVLNDSGELHRKEVASIVFQNPEKREILEKIIHPFIIDRIWDLVRKSTSKTVIIMAPLLFEAGLDKNCNMTIVVTASKDKAINRVVGRDRMSVSEVKNRIDSQMTDEDKIAKADFVIDNNGSLDELKVKVESLIDIIRDKDG